MIFRANIRDFHLSFFQMVAEWREFTVVTKKIKILKSLYGFGGRCFNIRDVCMDFEPCFKVYNLVSIRPKSMKLGQMWSFMWWGQFIDWLQFETRPSSSLNFGMAYGLNKTWEGWRGGGGSEVLWRSRVVSLGEENSNLRMTKERPRGSVVWIYDRL